MKRGRILKTPLFILSDFGYGDTYVAQMKAVILSFAGYDTPVIDLTHEVEPGNILHGAFHLYSALPHLPEGSVTLAVVDPGVGSNRFGLAALWRGRFIVAPDNGLISMLSGQIRTWKLPQGLSSSSMTFHGRDVFAEAAARLAVNPGWTSFLDELSKPVILKQPDTSIKDDSVQTSVLHVDNFGNCVLAVACDDLNEFVPLSLISDRFPSRISLIEVDSYYQSPEADAVLMLRGSQGFFELALNGKSAAKFLNLIPGCSLTLIGKRGSSE